MTKRAQMGRLCPNTAENNQTILGVVGSVSENDMRELGEILGPVRLAASRSELRNLDLQEVARHEESP